jgi:sec-independent protein translocase protein TatB
MFDVGFSELLVIAIVALVVIGPERLPRVARTAGHLLGRLQRYVNDVKADISREMQLDELRKLQAEVKDSARNLQQSISSEMQSVEHAVDAAVKPVVADAAPALPDGAAASGAQPATPAAQTPAASASTAPKT